MAKRKQLKHKPALKTKPKPRMQPLLLKKKPKAESFDLSFPNPEQSKPPQPQIQQEAIEVSAQQEIERIEAKKRMPHAATALLGSGVITILFATVFLLVMQIGEFYALCISLAIFFGFSILFYNLLETGD